MRTCFQGFSALGKHMVGGTPIALAWWSVHHRGRLYWACLTGVLRGSVGQPKPRVRDWRVAIWLGCAFGVGRASALPAQTPLSFRDALTMTQQQNRQLRAAEAQLDHSRA